MRRKPLWPRRTETLEKTGESRAAHARGRGAGRTGRGCERSITCRPQGRAVAGRVCPESCHARFSPLLTFLKKKLFPTGVVPPL